MDQNTSKLLAIKIKNIRKKLKLSQEKFCEKSNLDISTISNIENGKNVPALSTILAIMEAFEIEPNYMFDFIKYNKFENNTLDLLIAEHLKNVPTIVKNKILELLEEL